MLSIKISLPTNEKKKLYISKINWARCLFLTPVVYQLVLSVCNFFSCFFDLSTRAVLRFTFDKLRKKGLFVVKTCHVRGQSSAVEINLEDKTTRGVARIFKRGGHSVPYPGYSPHCHACQEYFDTKEI